MRPGRRSSTWLAFLGLVLALVVIQQQRGEPPTEDVVDGALRTIDEAGTDQQVAPAASAAGREPVSALTTASGDEADRMCVQTLEAVAEFAETEWIAANPTEALELSEEQELVLGTELENLPRRLANSVDPELFLTSYLLDPSAALRRELDEPSAQARLLELGTRAADSDSPLLAWHALRSCVAAEEYCPFPELEQSLLEVDRDNAEAWVLVAMLKHRRGDVAGALTAMQEAARASKSTWYWTESVAMLERSLASQTAQPPMHRLVNAIGTMASSPIPTISLRPMRSADFVASQEWVEACLAVGNLRGELNNTVLGQSSAYAIRYEALMALGDPQAAREVAKERVLFDADRTTSTGLPVLEALATYMPEVFLAAWQEFGEVEGRRVLFRQELPPLMDRAGLLERDGARECVAQFFELPVAVETRSATYRNYPIEEYPIQVGDQLRISFDGTGQGSTSFRVGSDGMIAMRRDRDIAAVGKTTGQLEREIATLLAEQGGQSDDVIVILMSSPSPEELRLAFDDALSAAAEGGDEAR